MVKKKTSTVGQYLCERLGQVGVKHIFGVPGDYALGFFDCLEKSDVDVIGTCNELNAGYAADGYARINGVGAVCVTYGVGGFSLLNAVVGSFAERVPVIVISGAPRLAERKSHHLLHHTIGDMNLQHLIYDKITIASVMLAGAEQAPRQIDETISACLKYRRPVYIEIPVDLVNKPCQAPGGYEIDRDIPSDPAVLAEAVEEASKMLQSADTQAVLAGVEVHRLGGRKELNDFIDHTGYSFATTLLGKTVLPEKHPQYVGVYNGQIGLESVCNLVEGSGVLLCLGTLMTDINLGVGTANLDTSKMIVANSDKVRIKHHIYENIALKDFIRALCESIPKGKPAPTRIDHPSRVLSESFTPEADNKITLKRFYERVNHAIGGNDIVISGTGDSLFCTAELCLPEWTEYVGQAFYLSIGYSVPAALGVKLAAPNRRAIVFVGDGAFQMTAQEISTIARHDLNPIIFLMNNDGYTVERAITDGPYNDIQMWDYHKLPDVFGGGWGCRVQTEGQLEEALERTTQNPGSMALIEVMLDKWDCSDNIRKLGQRLAEH